jgi:hypothetical protein
MVLQFSGQQVFDRSILPPRFRIRADSMLENEVTREALQEKF